MVVISNEELKREHPNIWLIKRLGKKVLESSEILSEYDMTSPVINKLKGMIGLNIYNVTNNKNRHSNYME